MDRGWEARSGSCAQLSPAGGKDGPGSPGGLLATLEPNLRSCFPPRSTGDPEPSRLAFQATEASVSGRVS